MSGTGGKRFFLHLKIFLCIKQDPRKSVRTLSSHPKVRKWTQMVQWELFVEALAISPFHSE